MSNIKIEYAASANFAITLASLASSATAARESTAIDNSSTKYIDALVQVQVKLAAGSPANDKAVYIYAYGSEDGTNYTDPATGANAAVASIRSPSNLKLVNIIACPDSGALTYKSSPFNIAHAFGGILPRKWGIVIRNFTGLALDSTEGNHAYRYSGVYMTNA